MHTTLWTVSVCIATLFEINQLIRMEQAKFGDAIWHRRPNELNFLVFQYADNNNSIITNKSLKFHLGRQKHTVDLKLHETNLE